MEVEYIIYADKDGRWRGFAASGVGHGWQAARAHGQRGGARWAGAAGPAAAAAGQGAGAGGERDGDGDGGVCVHVTGVEGGEHCRECGVGGVSAVPADDMRGAGGVHGLGDVCGAA